MEFKLSILLLTLMFTPQSSKLYVHIPLRVKNQEQDGSRIATCVMLPFTTLPATVGVIILFGSSENTVEFI